MDILCPYCQRGMPLDGVKPGKFITACPGCKGKFVLAVPADDDLPPLVKPIPPKPVPTAQRVTVPSATVPPVEVMADRDLRTVDRSNDSAVAGSTQSSSITTEAPAATASVAGLAAGTSVGSYRVVRELARGDVGVTYLARQPWLGREFTIEVVRPDWSRDPSFVARFMRMVYAAGQVRHPSLQSLEDLGIDRGTAFVVSERVEGTDLYQLVRQHGRLAPDEAVGYILPSARGLEAAHDQSLVHGFLTPRTLVVSADGLVQVAGLGRVTTPERLEVEDQTAATASAAGGPKPAGGVSATEWSTASGLAPVTVARKPGHPSYLAPEMASGTASLDPRSDVYSLGCVLFFLVTGRHPFQDSHDAGSARAIEPPEHFVPGLPKALCSLIQTMAAERPEQRFRDLHEAILALEAIQGITPESLGTALKSLQENSKVFQASPAARLRRWIPIAFVGLCALFAGMTLLRGRFVSAGAFLGLGLMTLLADFLITGVRTKTSLFQKARALVVTTPRNEWLLVAAGVIVGLIGLWVFKLFGVWLALVIVALAIAVTLHVVLDPKVEAERAGALEAGRSLVRSLRRKGYDEETLRQAVFQRLGTRGAEFFESLFGPDARREAGRTAPVASGRISWIRYSAIGDLVADWIDTRLWTRRENRERAALQAIEEAGLVAQGVNLMTARRRSKRAAEAMVALASELRGTLTPTADTIAVNRALPRSFREAATKPEMVLKDREHGLLRDPNRWTFWSIFTAVFGPKPRFLAGTALLGGCLLWMHQNGLIDTERAKVVADVASRGVEAVQKGDTEALQAQLEDVRKRGAEQVREIRARKTERLRLPGVPGPVLGVFSSFGAGAAGLILVISSFFRLSRLGRQH